MSNNNAKLVREARLAVEREIKAMVVVMGNDALNWFEDSFRNQGFTDEGLVRWKPRQNELRTFTSRAILTKTGRLRRSLRKRNSGQYAIQIFDNVPYASIHNEGGTIQKKDGKRTSTITAFTTGAGGFVNGRFRQGRKRKIKLIGGEHNVSAHTIDIPKRQFVGYSSKLNRQLIAKFDRKIKTIFG